MHKPLDNALQLKWTSDTLIRKVNNDIFKKKWWYSLGRLLYWSTLQYMTFVCVDKINPHLSEYVFN